MSTNTPQGDPRTLMAAVLFADLVGYSRKPVADQFAAKGSFRELLQGVLAPLAPESRLVLDTGDGAAIAFLSDPEHALYVALELRSKLASREAGGLLDPGDLRLGLNLGPVRRMTDLNGQPNLVGEGMNSAERVMSFASPGEITASRSYCDAISCLRESYRLLFEPLGRRTDKHGREHEVFRVGATRRSLEEARSSAGIDEAGAVEEARDRAPPPAEVRPGIGGKASGWIAAAVLAVLVGTAAAWLAGKGDPAADSPGTPPAISSGKVPEAKPPAPAPVEATESAAAASPAPSPVPGQPSASAPERVPDPAPVRHERPAPRGQAVAGDSSRCAALTQRAGLGEALSPKDQEELRKSCR